MARRTRPLRVAVLVALACAALMTGGLALAAGAGAAELQADFHFNGTRTAPTGQSVSDIGTGNDFVSLAVDGGSARPALGFPLGNGISVPTTGLAGSGSYSVALLFRLDSPAPGRRKLADFSGGSSDAGLYLCDGKLLIEVVAASPCPDGTGTTAEWLQVVLTRDGATGDTRAYLGSDAAAAADAAGLLALPAQLRLFTDDDFLPGGEHSSGALARLRVYDGVLSAAEAAALDRVDGTAPGVALGSLPGATADDTPIFSGTAGTEAGDLGQVTVRVYNGPTASGSPVRTLSTSRSGASWSVSASPSLADGTYTARAEQADGAGNVGASAARTFAVDTTGPQVSLDAPPAGATNDATPTYSGTAGDAAGDSGTVTVRVYAGGTASGEPVQTLSATRAGPSWSVDGSPALADGTYTAVAEQADSLGNTGASATRSFTVDTAEPAVTLNALPAMTNDSTPSYTGGAGVASGDSGTMTVRVYSGGAAAGEPVQTLTTSRAAGSWSAQSTSPLPDGVYTARAEQGDSAGNTGQSVARTFTVDTTEPAVGLNALPAATNDSTPSYGGSAGDAGGDSGTVTVKVYSGSSPSGTPVQTLPAPRAESSWSVTGSTPLPDGTYTAQSEQADAAGNTGKSPARTFRVDTAAPEVTVTDPTAGATRNRTPLYRGAAGTALGDEDEVTVRVYSGEGATGEPVQTLPASESGGSWSTMATALLPDGTYTVQAEQRDSAGNAGTSLPRTFTVDGAGPAVTLNTPATGTATNDNTPAYAGDAGSAAGDSSTVIVNVYGGDETSGTLVQSLEATRAGGTWSIAGTEPLADGVYTAQAEQDDGAGTGVSLPSTFTVDTLRPETSITGAPADPTTDSTPEFSFSSPDAGRFVCRLYPLGSASAPPFGDCSSPRAAGPLADGAYIFQVAAVDAAGNQDDSPGSRTFRVDTTPPRASIVVGPADSVSTDVAFVFSADEPVSFECRLDGGGWQPCGSPRSYTALALGPHTFEVVAVDSAGNRGAPVRHAWQVLRPGARIPAATMQAVALAEDLVAVRAALKRVPLARAAKRGAVTVRGVDAITPGTLGLQARARGGSFGVAQREAPTAGSYALRLKLTKRGRALARRVPKLRVDLTLTFTDTVGRALRAKTSATMLRRLPVRR